MSNKTDKAHSFIDLAWPLRIVCGVLFSGIFLVTIAQIFFRFILDDPIVWSEEIARFALIWMTFLGAAVIAWDGCHLAVDVFFLGLSDRAKVIVRWVNGALVVAIVLMFAWYGWPIVKVEMFNEIGSLNIKGGWFRVPGIIGAVLIAMAVIARQVYRLPREDDTDSTH